MYKNKNYMTSARLQKGVGLIEVLVAMLLLSVGVLGFSLLQVKAVESTAESDQRSQAVILAKDLSDRIGLTIMEGTPNQAKQIGASYQAALASQPVPAVCVSSKCSSSQLIAADTYDIYMTAKSKGMQVGMENCPAVLQSAKCAIVSWGKTRPTFGENPDTDCYSSKNYSYQLRSTCLMVELM